MNATSHQTLRLSRGRHVSPREGTCVMELASILAGESFSDHPRSACPVLGTIMRCYNDGIDDDRRQDLYWCAAAVVGTRSRAARAERIRRAAEFFGVRLTRLERAVPRFALHALGRGALAYARAAGEPEHRAFLSFVGELADADGADAQALYAWSPPAACGTRRRVAQP